MAALDTQLTATLPLEFHRLAIANHQLRIAKRRDQAYEVPEPPLLAGDKIDTSNNCSSGEPLFWSTLVLWWPIGMCTDMNSAANAGQKANGAAVITCRWATT